MVKNNCTDRLISVTDPQFDTLKLESNVYRRGYVPCDMVLLIRNHSHLLLAVIDNLS